MGARFCVIGKSLPHTLSPRVHAEFGRYDYDVVELEDEAALKNFVESGEYAGYNVTIPYKRSVMPFLDDMSDVARDVGAVNTVVNVGGRLVGDNTDVGGMEYALVGAGISLKDRNILILGSGGTSHTARYVAARAGAKSVNIVSRSGELNYRNCYGLKDTQIIINTTPVGMMPDSYAAPIDLRRYPRLEGVFDAIYNPLETLLVKEARALDIAAANGLEMLVEQARLSHNDFCDVCGVRVPPEASERACANIAKERRNIVLIGMAGAGKTSIAREVAKALGRQFADTDAEVERMRGMSVPEIFSYEGEAKFREYEAQAVKECCSGLGRVIATGGGAILREDNRFYMRANGTVVYVARDTQKLARKGRPLSTDAARVKELFESRKGIYEAMADVTVHNDKELSGAVEFVLKELEK